MQSHPGLFFAESKIEGRGMFCVNDIVQGALIEICPLIKIPKDDLKSIDQTNLYNYYFLMEDQAFPACIALGFGSLYNHSHTPNAEVKIDAVDALMFIEAIKDISAGEEIFLDYVGGPANEKELWFNKK